MVGFGQGSLNCDCLGVDQNRYKCHGNFEESSMMFGLVSYNGSWLEMLLS